MPHEELPFWQFNIPLDQRTATCPEFLLNSSEKDKRLISVWDSDYIPLSWQEVKQIITTNQIEQLRRSPSHLRRYRQFVYDLTQQYGSVLPFILRERLRWSDLTPRGPPLQHPEDYKILFNDWPYGIDERIVHLVVWTKFAFSEDTVTGDLTAAAREDVEAFVQTRFCNVLDREHVVWFKNWKSLKSVHAVEHFHVMLFDPDPAFVKEITQGDVPLYLDGKFTNPRNC